MRTKNLLPLFLIFVMAPGSILWGQNNYVPDENFDQTLIDWGYDDTLDDYVLTANISGVTDLDISEEAISDLTVIEDFTALTTLDVSNNTALTELYCYSYLSQTNELNRQDCRKCPKKTADI